MRKDILPLLHCPHCKDPLSAEATEEEHGEIKDGWLACRSGGHRFPISDGIMRFETGFGHEVVQKEIEYENETYDLENPLLRDREFIAGAPESLLSVWPHTFAFGPVFKDMIKVLGISPGSWVLDVGTASCWSSRLLAETGANVIALDVNDADYYGLKAADIQMETHGVHFERMLESMTTLPLADNSIDFITCNASLHHTPDLDQTLEEFHRVLKPGGKVGAANEALTSTRHQLSDLVDRLRKVEKEEEGSHHDISCGELEASARKAGFDFSYTAPSHLHDRLKERFGTLAGSAGSWFLKRSTLAVKQFKSTTLLLEKVCTPVHSNQASSVS